MPTPATPAPIRLANGDAVITCATTVNQAGNNTITFNDAGVTITQPVMFSVVVGSHPVAVESPKPQATSPKLPTLEVSPNPARGRVQLFAAAQEPATISIYTQSGGLVRTLALPGSPNAGQRVLAWDGNDLAGRPVAAGVYFVRLVSGGRSAVRRVVLAER